MKLDGKFHGVIVKNKDQSIVPQDQWTVFLAEGQRGAGHAPVLLRRVCSMHKNLNDAVAAAQQLGCPLMRSRDGDKKDGGL
jgi:hypothetical protein